MRQAGPPTAGWQVVGTSALLMSKRVGPLGLVPVFLPVFVRVAVLEPEEELELPVVSAITLHPVAVHTTWPLVGMAAPAGAAPISPVSATAPAVTRTDAAR